ncbi:helix-turn-helix transcriptional regulator [Planktothrix sp. FACHB-1365]|uniref:helix-turn-helix domain-containing protein n=1 Tax=Planktothrix sp. FACHB-1365 TaxID=2692855 RepID=UPI0016871B7B|nr:helix-turn-helix transcriptional regulator [Planktothrix sp. FACHB-1365]MBD2483520.1 helix-turn-helix transcriptional regulator [Planktothrix sp. FACHB-1365]
MTITICKLIRWKLREVMARQRVSIRQLAELTGLHRNTVAQLRGADTLPGLSQGTLEALCKALGCTPFELIEYDPD